MPVGCKTTAHPDQSAAAGCRGDAALLSLRLTMPYGSVDGGQGSKQFASKGHRHRVDNEQGN